MTISPEYITMGVVCLSLGVILFWLGYAQGFKTGVETAKDIARDATEDEANRWERRRHHRMRQDIKRPPTNSATYGHGTHSVAPQYPPRPPS